MSCSLTTDAVRERRKTVTRRLGWKFLTAGDRLWLCEKVMGRQGAPLVRLAYVEVVDARRELLWNMTDEDVEREGLRHGDAAFDEWYPDTGYPTALSWVDWFCEEMDVDPMQEVTRIEWQYLEPGIEAWRSRRLRAAQTSPAEMSVGQPASSGSLGPPASEQESA